MSASTKIASCYPTDPEPGTGTIGRLVEIRRDNTNGTHNRRGRFVCVTVHGGIGEFTHRKRTEEAAIAYAARLGFGEVVRP